MLSDFDGCLLPDELSDISQIFRLIERMQQRHFSDELIKKSNQKTGLGCWVESSIKHL